MSLNAQEIGQLERLFDQQMWAWGRDVQSPHGNLLLGYGFIRTPAPAGCGSSSVYRFEDLVLDSIGLTCGSIRLERGSLAWLSRQDSSRTALAHVFMQLIAYECWVAQHFVGWRQQSLDARTRRVAFSAEEMQAKYRELSAARTPYITPAAALNVASV